MYTTMKVNLVSNDSGAFVGYTLESVPDAFEIVCDYEYSAYKKDADDSDWNSSTTPDERRKFKFTRKATNTNVYNLYGMPPVVEQAVYISVI